MRSALLAIVSFVATSVIAASVLAQGTENVKRIGAVFTISPATISPGYTIGFWERLRQLGWIRGKNLLVEERWAEGQVERMPALIAEVIEKKVDVIITGAEAGAVAARKATNTIPIIVTAIGDPIAAGVAASLSRPGGNLTGFSLQSTEGVPGKCLELLREVIPRASVVAVLWNPDVSLARAQEKQLQKDARTLGITLDLIAVRSFQSLESAVDRAKKHAAAALVLSDPLTYHHRRYIASLANNLQLPLMSTMFDAAADGALMAYGADLRPTYWRAAEYVDKVLRGTNPGDLPIEQPSQLKLAVNLGTARILKLKIPESVIVRADEVIQ